MRGLVYTKAHRLQRFASPVGSMSTQHPSCSRCLRAISHEHDSIVFHPCGCLFCPACMIRRCFHKALFQCPKCKEEHSSSSQLQYRCSSNKPSRLSVLAEMTVLLNYCRIENWSIARIKPGVALRQMKKFASRTLTMPFHEIIGRRCCKTRIIFNVAGNAALPTIPQDCTAIPARACSLLPKIKTNTVKTVVLHTLRMPRRRWNPFNDLLQKKQGHYLSRSKASLWSLRGTTQECGDWYLQAFLDDIGTWIKEMDRMRLCHQALIVAKNLLLLPSMKGWRISCSPLLK